MADSVHILDLADIISAPLIAVVEADGLAARRLAQFIRDIGFKGEPNRNDLGELNVLTFTYERPGSNDRLVVTVPLLSLIPLPALQVKQADFDFNVSILEATSGTASTSGAATTGGKPVSPATSLDVPRSGLKVMMAPTPTQSGSASQQISANMHITVRMEQADMPAGLSKLLNVMAQTVASRTEPTKTGTP